MDHRPLLDWRVLVRAFALQLPLLVFFAALLLVGWLLFW